MRDARNPGLEIGLAHPAMVLLVGKAGTRRGFGEPCTVCLRLLMSPPRVVRLRAWERPACAPRRVLVLLLPERDGDEVVGLTPAGKSG